MSVPEFLRNPGRPRGNESDCRARLLAAATHEAGLDGTFALTPDHLRAPMLSSRAHGADTFPDRFGVLCTIVAGAHPARHRQGRHRRIGLLPGNLERHPAGGRDQIRGGR